MTGKEAALLIGTGASPPLPIFFSSHDFLPHLFCYDLTSSGYDKDNPAIRLHCEASIHQGASAGRGAWSIVCMKTLHAWLVTYSILQREWHLHCISAGFPYIQFDPAIRKFISFYSITSHNSKYMACMSMVRFVSFRASRRPQLPHMTWFAKRTRNEPSVACSSHRTPRRL